MEERDLDLIVSVADDVHGAPDEQQLAMWCLAALADQSGPRSLGLRVAGEAEVAAMNSQYRHREGPTNILSFPADLEAGLVPLLGDLVICLPVVERQATEQGKTASDHWAHLVIHGVLHLLGHDHEDAEEAALMEGIEVGILKDLGIADPYTSDP